MLSRDGGTECHHRGNIFNLKQYAKLLPTQRDHLQRGAERNADLADRARNIDRRPSRQNGYALPHRGGWLAIPDDVIAENGRSAGDCVARSGFEVVSELSECRPCDGSHARCVEHADRATVACSLRRARALATTSMDRGFSRKSPRIPF